MTRQIPRPICFAFLIAICCLVSQPLTAATILVSTVSDAIAMDNRCTLREAVIAANTDAAFSDCPAGDGPDVIELFFESPHTLAVVGAGEDDGVTGDLDIRDDLTIRPTEPGVMRIIDAAGVDRVFDVIDGANLTLDRIEVRGGFVTGFGGGFFVRDAASELQLLGSRIENNEATSFGGGIFSRGPVLLLESILSDNEGSDGGGLFMSTASPVRMWDSRVEGNTSTSNGGGLNLEILEAERSVIAGNFAGQHGGGVFWRSDSSASDVSWLVNVTVAENGANSDGGGIFVATPGSVELRSTTIAWNAVDVDQNDAGDGGGLRAQGGTVRLQNTVVAANDDFSSGSEAPDCSGAVESLGYNLLAAIDGGCAVTGTTTGNLIGSLATPIVHGLDCLASNGGPTRSVAPTSSSPVLDAADPAGCTDQAAVPLRQDQRGHNRTWDGPDGDTDARCDMGAVELDAPIFNLIFANDFESGDITGWDQSVGATSFAVPTSIGTPAPQGLPYRGRWRSELGHEGGGGGACDDPKRLALPKI